MSKNFVQFVNTAISQFDNELADVMDLNQSYSLVTVTSFLHHYSFNPFRSLIG
jgi:hypothetical protein